MTSCQQIVTSLSYFHFMADLHLDSNKVIVNENVSIKLKFSLTIMFYFTKTESKTKKSLTQLSYYCFEYRYYFCQKMLTFFFFFLKNICSFQQSYGGFWHFKVYFLKFLYFLYLRIKFQASSLMLTSFRQDF